VSGVAVKGCNTITEQDQSLFAKAMTCKPAAMRSHMHQLIFNTTTTHADQRLLRAAQSKDPDGVAEVLKDYKPHINAQDINGNTSLMNAMEWTLVSDSVSEHHVRRTIARQAETVKILLNAPGIDVTVTNYNGRDAVDMIFKGLAINQSLLRLLTERTMTYAQIKARYPNYEALVNQSSLKPYFESAKN
jgi:hypothetical protein